MCWGCATLARLTPHTHGRGQRRHHTQPLILGTQLFLQVPNKSHGGSISKLWVWLRSMFYYLNIQIFDHMNHQGKRGSETNHPLETWMIHLRILIFSKFSLLHQIKAFFRSTKYFFFYFIYLFVLWLHLRHTKGPRPGIESSCSCDQLQQHQVL